MSDEKGIKKRLRPDSGEALLEIALVLPILLVLSMGMLDFGRAFHAKNMVDAAAREGCRVAVVTAPDVALAQTRAGEILTAAGLTASSVTVVGGPLAADKMVTVTVNTTFTFVTPGIFTLIGASYGNTINMIGKSSMRMEGV
jgi:Flp pilus assembly protein TadG